MARKNTPAPTPAGTTPAYTGTPADREQMGIDIAAQRAALESRPAGTFDTKPVAAKGPFPTTDQVKPKAKRKPKGDHIEAEFEKVTPAEIKAVAAATPTKPPKKGAKPAKKSAVQWALDQMKPETRDANYSGIVEAGKRVDAQQGRVTKSAPGTKAPRAAAVTADSVKCPDKKHVRVFLRKLDVPKEAYADIYDTCYKDGVLNLACIRKVVAEKNLTRTAK